MAELEMVPYKDFLICPTPVRAQTAPRSVEYRWRDSGYIYPPEREMVRNIPGTAGFETREQARAAVIAEAKRVIDAGP